MVDRFLARILSRIPTGGGLDVLSLEVPNSVRESHVAHGQYVELTHEHQHGVASGYFALTNAPKSQEFRLFVKQSGSLGAQLSRLTQGDHLHCSLAKGDGYPFEQSLHNELWLIVSGSALSAVYSTLEARTSIGLCVKLVYGIRHENDIAMKNELEALSNKGASIQFVFSEKAQTDHPDKYYGPYVQDWLRRAQVPQKQTRIFAAGSDDMLKQLRAYCRETPTLEVFSNH